MKIFHKENIKKQNFLYLDLSLLFLKKFDHNPLKIALFEKAFILK